MTLLLPFLILAPKPLPAMIADVLKTPAKYDGKAVVVKGKVLRFVAKTSKAGRPYFLLDLVDGKAKLKVYGGDKISKPFKDGDTATVTGRYAHERKLGDRIYKDEIDASTRLDKAFGVRR